MKALYSEYMILPNLAYMEIKWLVFSEYYKHREELGCMEGESCGVSEWGVAGIRVGNMLGNNVENDE